MSSDNTTNNNSNNNNNNNNNNNSNNTDMAPRNRRSSISQAALTNLFSRSGSLPNGSGFPSQINGASAADAGRRRLSVTTLGLSGTSPTNAPSFNLRRGSLSTISNSDSIDENAIEDEEMPGARTVPTTPFVRRMSFGAPAMRNRRGNGSPGNGNNPSSPPLGRTLSGKRASMSGSSISTMWSSAGRRSSTAIPSSPLPQASSTKHPRAPSDNYPSRPDQQGFNWSEQLRSRAESSVTGARPSFSLASTSPPRGPPAHHDRAKSVSDMPQPPVQASSVKPRQERPKPDAFQERILKGDFYMD